jgi:hypothetical protein
MASALAIDAMVAGAAGAPSVSHTGVYRVARGAGREERGISGMLFLREDRACVLRLAVAVNGDRTLIRLVRGIWWPVAVGVKVMTSDGFVSVWPAKRNSVVVKLPLAAFRGERETNGADIKFVRVR